MRRILSKVYKIEQVHSLLSGEYTEKKQNDYSPQGNQKYVQVRKVNNLAYGLHSHKTNINTKY